MDEALRAQLEFIGKLGELKSVIRRNYLADGSRQENSAEHSWHVAMLAWVCAEQADEPIDVDKAVRMLLLHDVVEIEAGDTYIYDLEARRGQEARERAAAERLFGLLPAGQGAAFRALWNEYEACETPEARYAKAIDGLLPLLQTTANGGAFWREHGITREQVMEAKRPIAEGSQALWRLAQALIDEAHARGVLK